MFARKNVWFLLILLVALWNSVIASLAHAEVRSLRSQLLAYAGNSYSGVQDPEYLAYDSALRDYMVERINKHFGIKLDPKAYSGFTLLDIEAFFKCKKSDEPFDFFLKMFPQRP